MMVTAIMTLPAASNLMALIAALERFVVYQLVLSGMLLSGLGPPPLVVQPAREVIKNTKIKGRSRHI